MAPEHLGYHAAVLHLCRGHGLDRLPVSLCELHLHGSSWGVGGWGSNFVGARALGILVVEGIENICLSIDRVSASKAFRSLGDLGGTRVALRFVRFKEVVVLDSSEVLDILGTRTSI